MAPDIEAAGELARRHRKDKARAAWPVLIPGAAARDEHGGKAIAADHRFAAALNRAPAAVGQHQDDVLIVLGIDTDMTECRARHHDRPERDLHAGMPEAAARRARVV